MLLKAMFSLHTIRNYNLQRTEKSQSKAIALKLLKLLFMLISNKIKDDLLSLFNNRGLNNFSDDVVL